MRVINKEEYRNNNEEKFKIMNSYIDRSIELNSIWETNGQYPDVSVDNQGNSFVVYQESIGDKDSIVYHSIRDGVLSTKKTLSVDALCLRPSVHSFGGETLISWSEYKENTWHLVYTKGKDNTFTNPITVCSGDALFYPFVGDNGKEFYILFNKMGPSSSDVYLYKINSSSPVKINDSSKCYRPTGVATLNGNLFVSYDVFNGSSYDIMMKACIDGVWTGEVKINTSGNRCAQPVLAISGDTVVVGWYENGMYSYFSYQVADIELVDGNITISNYQVLVQNRNWYNNVAITHNAQGYVVFSYTIGKYNVLTRVRNLNGVWSNAALLSYNDGQCGVRPKVSLDNTNTLHYVWQFAKKNGHQMRNAVIVYNSVHLDELAKKDDNIIETKIDSFVQPIDVVKMSLELDEKVKNEWLKKNNLDDNLLLFGDIHGQSNMSDGMGEIDQYYHAAKYEVKMDFCALTDHDCYPDEATKSEWEFNRTHRNLFNEEPDFAAILAFEWTSNEYKHDFGHKNVYYPSHTGSLFTSIEEKGMNPDRLYASIKEEGGLCISHHPAANWSIVSAATDWDYHDEEVERLVEMFSRHANYEKTSAVSKYTKNIAKFDRHCAQDALDRGYHLGFTAGSDSHQMEHGVEGGIVAVYAKEHTSEDVWSALYNRATYATTGTRMLLHFAIDNHPMGSIIEGKDEIVLTISVLSPSELKKAEIIKNGEVIMSYPLEGKELDTTLTLRNEGNEDYYYLRVEQEDEQCAWSSPIWVK